MKDLLAGIIMLLLWIVIIMQHYEKDDRYKRGYTDGYQSRINYERGL